MDLITDADFSKAELERAHILSSLLSDRINNITSHYGLYGSRIDPFKTECLLHLFSEGYIESPEPSHPIVLTPLGIKVASYGSYLKLIYNERKEEKAKFAEAAEKKKQNKNSMSINWVTIYNKLFEIINTPGETYLTGTQYLSIIREVDQSFPPYATFIEQRREAEKSVTRRDYYYDLFMEQSEEGKRQIAKSILQKISSAFPEKAAAITQLLGQANQVQGPQANIPQELWNADRLREYLERMDSSIEQGNFEHTLTLAYTCLEGFYKSFIAEKIPAHVQLNELVPMSVQIKAYIKAQLDASKVAYPDLALNLISTATNTIANARNNFSDSHSGNRAEKWLAVYLRDNVNSLVKLLLNFL